MGSVANFFTTVLGADKDPRRGGDSPDAAEAAPPPVAPAPPGSKWGIAPELLGPAYDATGIFAGERAAELEFKRRYYYCRQHDQKPFDMNGAPLGDDPASRRGGFPGMPGFLAMSGEARFVPIAQRRPCAPYRLSRSIVKSFTAMVWGENRWPQIRSDDPRTQAFCEAIIKAANVKNRMTRERNVAGACGTSGLSWMFRDGKPVVHVHNGRFIEVLEWEDPDELLPRHVTELYRTFARRLGKDGRVERYEVWNRKDWTSEADVVFKPVEVTPDNPVEWVVDEERSFPHGDGFCHFVWIPNVPDDEDPGTVDGQPDYEGLYEQFDAIDGTNSILVHGTNRNLDPTLHIATEDYKAVKTVQKGSNAAIVTEPGGSAEYLTLPADVVTAGESLVNMQRRQALEVSQCIIADPDKVAAAGTSSLTMKLVYAPMIAQSDILREPHGTALVRLLEQILGSARRQMGVKDEGAPSGADEIPVEVEEPAPEAEATVEDEGDEEAKLFEPEELDPEEQQPERVEYVLSLPPRVVSEDEVDAEGKPTGKTIERKVEQHPGMGKVELEWGDYFPPTSDDKQKTMTTYSTAAGARPIISQRSAVESTAAMLLKDPTEEWRRVQDEAAQACLEVQGAGGVVENERDGPDGITPPVEPEEPREPEAAPAPGEGGAGAEE